MAVKFEWNEVYELGISEIDLQHKKLIDISNDLFDVVTKGDENFKISMSKILKNLTDYTVYHFTSEEQFMANMVIREHQCTKSPTITLFLKLLNKLKNLKMVQKKMFCFSTITLQIGFLLTLQKLIKFGLTL